MSTTTTLYAAIQPNHLTPKGDGTFTLSYTGRHEGLRNMIKGLFHTSLVAAQADAMKYPLLDVYKVEGTFPDGAVFTVTQNSDQNEGRGGQVKVASFSNFDAALEISRGRGVMGYSDGTVEMTVPAGNDIYRSAEEFRAAQKGQAPTRKGSGKVYLYDGYFGVNLDYFTITVR